MIAVRIPDEIRKYKEKIMLGLTARQLIATAMAFLVCVPLYFFGKSFINDEILTWLIILIAVPLVGIGFFRFNGMPMEKYMVVMFKYELLHPQKRKFISENAFWTWQKEAEKIDKPKSSIKKMAAKKYRQQASLERSVLIMEAEEQGNIWFDANAVDLLTVSTGRDNKGPDKNKKRKRKVKNRSSAKSPLQKKAESIEKEMSKNPQYLPSKKEFNILKRWKQTELKKRKNELSKKKKILHKKTKNLEKRKKARTTVPRSTQQTIPFIADYDEGVFEVSQNKFSKMYKLKDINYTISHEEDQVRIFCKLGEFYNYFSEDMHIQIVIDNRFVSTSEQEHRIFYPTTGDKYDRHRIEYNNILRSQIIAGRNDMQVEKFVIVTIDADTAIEALLRFHKIDAEVIENLRKIGSDANVLSTEERLSYYHDKFRRGRENDFAIDFDFIKTQGISSKDYIAPSYFHFDRKHFQIEDDYYRVLYLNNLPASLSDELLFELYDNEFAVTASMSIQPVAQDKGLRIVKKQLTGIEMNKMDAEKRAVRAGYNPETIQHSIKDAHAQAEALYDDMLNKNQKMFFVTFTFMVHGSTLDELNENCKILEGKARKFTTQLQTLTSQQEEGFKITLPFGYPPCDVSVNRTLTTESTSIFMPFRNQELYQIGGFYYGLNQISFNLVIINRTALKTPSGFVLGTTGSGKSFATKREIINVLLNDAKTGVLIIDPENEYGDFCRAFGGSVLKISADSNNYINPMDMSEDYGLDEDDDASTPLSVKKDKAMKKKSDYIMSIVERMISVGNNGDSTTITPQQKTIVDRCVYRCYRQYLDRDFDPNYLPTLLDLQNELDREKVSEEGRMVAEGVEYYTRGSMDIFAHKTNVEVSNRLVVFNVRDLGEQLRQIGLIIVFDFIWNRMIENKNKGVRTYCYCDEIHVMFLSYYSANFLKQLYKRGRKYGLCITGLTQNVEDLLRSEQARGMIGNSDFIMMLSQNSEDLRILAGMLNISEEQLKYVVGAEPGSGLIFAEKVIVPFIDHFPKTSYLYKLMSTRFGEDMSRAEIDAQINEIMEDDKNLVNKFAG